jgi:hypothetical protein
MYRGDTKMSDDKTKFIAIPEFRVGDTIRAHFCDKGGDINSLSGIADYVSEMDGALTISGCKQWFHPRQCELIERKPQYVKKTMYATQFNHNGKFYLGPNLFESLADAIGDKGKDSVLADKDAQLGYAPIEVWIKE